MTRAWTAPATLHAYSGTPETYNGYDAYPDVEYGSRVVYVGFDDYAAGTTVRDVYIISSADYGGTWSAPTAIATTAYDEFAPVLAAVKSNLDARTVVAGYTKYYGGLDWDIWYAYTQDGGGTWYTNYCLACYSGRIEAFCDLATSESQGLIHIAFFDHATTRYTSAPYDNPATWAPLQDASDPGVASVAWAMPGVTVDPTQPLQTEAGIAWTDERTVDREIYFDGPITPAAGVDGAEQPLEDLVITCLPNPFTASTTVSFSLMRRGPVKAGIYDVSGRLVRSLVDGASMKPGENRITWDGLDGSGRCAGPGVYYVRVSTPDGARASKVVVMQ